MSVLHGDTFDFYSTLTQYWTQIYSTGGDAAPTITAAMGLNGTYGVRWTGFNSRSRPLAITLAPTGAKCVIQTALYIGNTFSGMSVDTSDDPSSTTTNAAIFYVRQGGATQIWLRVNTNGTLSLMRGSTVLATSSLALQQAAYHYFEAESVIANSGGTFIVKVDGTEFINFTGDTQNTASATWDEVVLIHIWAGNGGQTLDIRIDDVLIMDGDGSIYNGMIGDHEGRYCPALAEGAHTDGVPSSGADRALMVDEAPADGDTTYNTKSAAGEIDSFTVDNWPSSGPIGPVIAVAQQRKEDAGSATVKLGVRFSGTDHDGAEQGLATTYAIKKEIFEINPETAVAWVGGTAPEVIDRKHS
jgi:hypothetical protein